MSAIESVTAIRTDGQPCCIEILVADVDHGLPDPRAFPGIVVVPDDRGLITLDLRAAQELRARLDVAIRALEQHGPIGDPRNDALVNAGPPSR